MPGIDFEELKSQLKELGLEDQFNELDILRDKLVSAERKVFDLLCETQDEHEETVYETILAMVSYYVEEQELENMVKINDYKKFIVVNTKPTKIRIHFEPVDEDDIWGKDKWQIIVEPYFMEGLPHLPAILMNLSKRLNVPCEEYSDAIEIIATEENLLDLLLEVISTLCNHSHDQSSSKKRETCEEQTGEVIMAAKNKTDPVERDPLFNEAARFIVESGTPRSILMLKDQFKLDHDRVIKLFFQLEDAGIISLRPQSILVDKELLEQILKGHHQ